MNENQQKIADEKKPVSNKTNEHMGFELSSSVRIFDPETKEVLLQMRAD